MKTCSCGSGKERRELLDAAGIFCTFICDDCEEEKRSRFRSIIFDPDSTYAATGDEEDLPFEDLL